MIDVNNPVTGSKRARTVIRDRHKSSGTVRDTAQKKVEQLRAGVADCARAERDKVRPIERSVAQYVQEQPLKSLLIAAGVGLVLGRFWMRR